MKFSDLEKELQGINLDIVKKQFETLVNQADFQQRAFQVIEPVLANMLQQQQVEAGLFTPEQQRQRMLDQIAREDQMYAAQDELLQTELARIRGGTGATDEQKALINAATEAQIQRGESDIKAFGQDALQMIAQELAPSRGLRPTDTPIQDRGFQVGKEMARQYGQLVTGLRGEQAQAELNFPLAANQSQAALSQYQQQLNQSALQFNQQLQQQAQQNRLNLFGQTGQLGLNLYGVGQPFANLQQAFKPQIGQFSTSSGSSSSGGVSMGDVGTGLAAIAAI